MATYISSQKTFIYDEQDMQDTAGEASTNLYVTFFYGPQHMDRPVLTNQQ